MRYHSHTLLRLTKMEKTNKLRFGDIWNNRRFPTLLKEKKFIRLLWELTGNHPYIEVCRSYDDSAILREMCINVCTKMHVRMF